MEVASESRGLAAKSTNALLPNGMHRECMLQVSIMVQAPHLHAGADAEG